MPADMPPRWMWHLTEELEDWFAEVKERRGQASEPDDREEVDMWENELVRDRRR